MQPHGTKFTNGTHFTNKNVLMAASNFLNMFTIYYLCNHTLSKASKVNHLLSFFSTEESHLRPEVSIAY